MTTILTKKKDTSGAPAPGDLTNAAGGAELAVNTADKRLYTKDSGGNVVEIGTNPTILNIDNIQIDGNTISSTNTNGAINLSANGTGNIVVGSSSTNGLVVNSTIKSNLIFTDNTYDIGASGATRPRNLFLAGAATIEGNVTLNGGTANGVAYLNGSKVLTTGSALTFDGKDLGVGNSRVSYGANISGITLDNTGANQNIVWRVNSVTQASAFTNGKSGFIFDTETNVPLQFQINGSEQMRLTSTGLGVGTTSPSTKLQVNFSSATAYSSGATGNGLLIYNTSTTNGQYVGITFQGEPTAGNAGIATIYGTTTSSGNMDLVFSTRGSSTLAERARITSTGNFAIGDTGASSKLFVRSDSSDTVFTDQANVASGSGIIIQNESSTTGSWAALTAVSRNNSSVLQYASMMSLASGSGYAPNIVFAVSDSATTSAERMRISSTGLVGIGTNNPQTALQVNAGAPTIRLEETTTGGSKRLEMGVTSAGVAFIGANQSAQDLVFQTVGSERMRVGPTGNVGIGTSSPARPLEVAAAVGIDTTGSPGKWTAGFRDLTATAAAGVGGSLLFQGLKSTAGSVGNFGAIAGLKENSTNGNEDGYLAFFTVPNSTGLITERGRFDSSGRLLVGTTSNFGGAGQFAINQSGGSIPAIHLIGTNVVGGGGREIGAIFSVVTNDTGPAYGNVAKISAAKENGTQGNTAGYMAFQTTPNGGSLTERARIDSVGRFLVNNASSLNSDAYIQATGGPYPIWIQGSSQGYTQGAMVISSATTDSPSGRGLGIYMWNQATTATWYTGTAYGSGDNWFIMRKTGGAFRPDTADVALGWLMLMSASGAGYQGNNSSTWSTTSDARVKDDVKTIENGLDVVLALRPVDFYNKVTKKREENFIAQEYERVLAKHVTREEPVGAEQEFVTDEILRLNPNLVPYLVSAIQKLNAEIEALKATRN